MSSVLTFNSGWVFHWISQHANFNDPLAYSRVDNLLVWGIENTLILYTYSMYMYTDTGNDIIQPPPRLHFPPRFKACINMEEWAWQQNHLPHACIWNIGQQGLTCLWCSCSTAAAAAWVVHTCTVNVQSEYVKWKRVWLKHDVARLNSYMRRGVHICCSVQTGQHEPRNSKCCPLWILQ